MKRLFIALVLFVAVTTTATEGEMTVMERSRPRLKSLGTFTVTGYCKCRICCGKWAAYDGITKSGKKVEAGRTCAVDPEVISLGTRLWIETRGWRIAEDTGSAVKGRMIDLYFDSHQEALVFGRQHLTVMVEGDEAIGQNGPGS